MKQASLERFDILRSKKKKINKESLMESAAFFGIL
jgi:hypothetical protein